MELIKTIKVPTKILTRFKKIARENFPNEIFCYLLGHILNDQKYEITDLYFPVDLKDFCTPHIVHVQDHWITEVKKYARKHKVQIIGDLHSHPYTFEESSTRKITDLSPSEQDWDRDTDTDGPLMGICLTKQRKDGTIFSKIKFWGPLQKTRMLET